MKKNFTDLDIEDKIKKAIVDMGIDKMTPIQSKSIKYILRGRDLMGAAKTGSGKTLAFLVPLLNKVVTTPSKVKGTQAIIISPTRDLSLQILSELKKLNKYTKVSIGAVIGGAASNKETQALAGEVKILIATPGRLADHMKNCSNFNYSNLHTLILDEADKLMQQGFLREMTEICGNLPKNRLTALFSATLNISPREIRRRIKTGEIASEDIQINLKEKVAKLAFMSLKSNCKCVDLSCEDLPAIVQNGGGNLSDGNATNAQLKHNFVEVKPSEKFAFLCNYLIINNDLKTMIFFATRAEVVYYNKLLNALDFKCQSLHGNQKNKDRESHVRGFAEDVFNILCCTDVAARGLDIPDVQLVIQYDAPDDPNEYIHRVGRTARAGAGGQALLILRPHELQFIECLKQHKVQIEPIENAFEFDKSIEDYQIQLVKSNEYLSVPARNAFVALVGSYRTNKLSSFNVYDLNLNDLAKTFCLSYTPSVSHKRKNNHIDSYNKEFKKRKY